MAAKISQYTVCCCVAIGYGKRGQFIPESQAVRPTGWNRHGGERRLGSGVCVCVCLCVYRKLLLQLYIALLLCI